MNLKRFEQTGWCGSAEHELSRRTFLKAAGLTGLTWLTPLSQLLAIEAERSPGGAPAGRASWRPSIRIPVRPSPTGRRPSTPR
jgi:hypothetical protein